MSDAGLEPTFPLATKRLVLRAHIAEDAGPLHAIYSRPEVARFLLEGPWTEQDARTKVAERANRTGLSTPSGALALVIEVDGRIAGDVALWWSDRDGRIAEIGWVLDPELGGHGYASEAAAAVVASAFDGYNARRLVARMDARNDGSAALARRLGMTREAHLREDWWSKGEWTDTLVFGLLATDPREADRHEASGSVPR